MTPLRKRLKSEINVTIYRIIECIHTKSWTFFQNHRFAPNSLQKMKIVYLIILFGIRTRQISKMAAASGHTEGTPWDDINLCFYFCNEVVCSIGHGFKYIYQRFFESSKKTNKLFLHLKDYWMFPLHWATRWCRRSSVAQSVLRIPPMSWF